MPRAQKHPPKQRHDPLHVQLADDEVHAKYGRVSQPGKRRKSRQGEEAEENGDAILDPKTSKRIFELAKSQQEELEEPDEEVVVDDDFTRPRLQDLEEAEEEEDVENYHGFIDLDEEEHELQIDSDDIKALDTLLPPNAGERKTLADLIFAKLGGASGSGTAVIQPSGEARTQSAPDPAEGLDPKVVEVYTKVGTLLQSYRAGPLPKPFKIIPSLPAWARILALTHPERWSPHAVHAATRIFISNMKPPQARVFLEGVVLDAVRADIADKAPNRRDNRRLSPHLYEALKRALYKPGAFFKGIVFPMLESGCTLQEAAIVASVLAKVRVPRDHSAGALHRIAGMDYAGPNSLVIRVLLDKKHALPYKNIDSLVFHFIRLANTYKARSRADSAALPVLWHQSLLVFVQRYAADLTPDQKDALLDVVRAHPHPQIGPEVRRELVNSVVRGEPREEDDATMDMS